MGDKKLGQVIAETEKQKEKENGNTIREIGGRPTCTSCGYEWSSMLSDDEWPTECSECERKEGKPIKFFELSITIRAGSIDDIMGLIPRVTGSFMNGDERVGSWCGDDSNYEFNLSER